MDEKIMLMSVKPKIAIVKSKLVKRKTFSVSHSLNMPDEYDSTRPNSGNKKINNTTISPKRINIAFNRETLDIIIESKIPVNRIKRNIAPTIRNCF